MIITRLARAAAGVRSAPAHGMILRGREAGSSVDTISNHAGIP